MRRAVLAGFLVFVALVVTAVTASAISAGRCARKCGLITEQCILARGVAQCGTADPSRPCLDALRAQCQSETGAACLETDGDSCRKPSCAERRAAFCACQAEPVRGLLADDLTRLCRRPGKRCRRQASCGTTTTTTLPGVQLVLLCCVSAPVPGSQECSIVATRQCPIPSDCQQEFAAACEDELQRVAVPTHPGESCEDSYDCSSAQSARR